MSYNLDILEIGEVFNPLTFPVLLSYAEVAPLTGSRAIDSFAQGIVLVSLLGGQFQLDLLMHHSTESISDFPSFSCRSLQIFVRIQVSLFSH